MSIINLNFILDLLLCTIIYPFLAFLLFLFWTYKQFVIIAAKITQTSSLVPLNACDSLTAIDALDMQSDGAELKTSMRLNVGLVLRLKQNNNLNISWLRTKFENTFLKRNVPASGVRPFTNLYSYLVTFGGHTFRKFVDVVNLEQHVQTASVPNTQSLQEYLVHFFEAGYKQGTPFWKVLLIPAPDAEDEVIVVLKIHHSLADGYTIIHILDMLTGSKTPYTVKDFQDSVWDKIKFGFRAPRMLLRFAREMSLEPPMFSFDKDEGQFFSFTTLSLEDLKKVRRITGSKFDAVYIALLGGVARRLLLENSSEYKLPKSTCISSAAAWPNHPCASGREGEMCNHATMTGVQVPMCENSLDRLRAVDLNYKENLELEIHKITFRLVMPFLVIVPNCVREMWAASSPVQLACSMNMGSVQHYFLNQNEIKSVHIISGCPLPNTAMMGTSFSNSNRFECTMAIRKSIAGTQEISDRICSQYLSEELQGLLLNVNATVVAPDGTST